MVKRIILALSLVLMGVGCGPDPLPDTITIVGAEPWQTVVLEDTLDHWCRGTGWCADVGPGGALAIFTTDYPKVKRDEGKPAYHHHGVIRYNAEHWQINDIDWLWTIAAHEFGHHGSKKHSPDPESLMHNAVYAPSAACLDRAAVDQFCDESGQCLWRASTCDQL